MTSDLTLLRRIRALTLLFIVGLVVSGITAIPLRSEVKWLAERTGAQHLVEVRGSTEAPAWALWVMNIHGAIEETARQNRFLFYGTDWLAFGHIAIGIAFLGALRDPVRNRWLFVFGLIVCGLVIPYALVLGAIRGIPLWWRLIDCSFGLVGAIPLWLCIKWVDELSRGDKV
jgi:hypothetical protein